ncbi:MAG: carboxypeptidase-like regulatory domain-containing protein [Gemmataceae bacterium]
MPALSNPIRIGPNIAKSGGVAHAIVWLEGLTPRNRLKGEDTRRVQPKGLFILQGQAARSVGNPQARRQDRGRQPRRTLLRLESPRRQLLPTAAAEAKRSSSGALDQSGITELGCGGGFYWLRAYLYVSDHPFAATTDADGSFRMNNVPPGNYRVVAWLPNWHVAGQDLDFREQQTLRVHFASPVEKRTVVEMKPGAETSMQAEFSAKDFAVK